jgi:hypothetical protein
MNNPKQLRDPAGDLVTQFRTEGPAPPPDMDETVSELEATDESTDRTPKEPCGFSQRGGIVQPLLDSAHAQSVF